MEAGERRVSIRVMQCEKPSLAIGGFEDGRGAPAKECMQPVEAGKGKK